MEYLIFIYGVKHVWQQFRFFWTDLSNINTLTIHNLLGESRIIAGGGVNTVRKFFPETWIWDLVHTEWVLLSSLLTSCVDFWVDTCCWNEFWGEAMEHMSAL